MDERLKKGFELKAEIEKLINEEEGKLTYFEVVGVLEMVKADMWAKWRNIAIPKDC